MRRWGRISVAAIACAAASGCAAQRLVPPPSPAWDGDRPDASHVRLEIAEVYISNLGEADFDRHRARLASSFINYVSSRAFYESVRFKPDTRFLPEGALGVTPVRLRAYVRVDHERWRTILFDAPFFYPAAGFWPFSPLWGDAIAEITVMVDEDDGGRTEIAKTTVRAPFTVLFYSWYRTRPIEDAFARAYAAAFTEIGDQIAAAVILRAKRPAPALLAASEAAVRPIAMAATPMVAAAELAPFAEPAGGAAAAAVESSPPAETAESAVTAATAADLPVPALVAGPLDGAPVAAALPLLAAPGPLVGADPPALPLLAMPIADTGPRDMMVSSPDLTPPAPPREPKAEIILPPDGFGVVTSPREHADRGLLTRYLAGLGGVEGAYFSGVASVASRARTMQGTTETVGSGTAYSEGYKISLFKPPDRTGFFFPPSVGFLSQTITIEGFRQEIPLLRAEGRDDIEAVVSDPETGLAVDANAPISYLLKLQSGHIGQRVGANFVLGNDWIEVFGTIEAGLNVFEVRHTNVRIDTSEVSGFSVAAFQSGTFAAQAGVVFPDVHLALRAALQYDWYLDFDYPKPIEFQASLSYIDSKDVFQRERVFVDGAAFDEFNWQVSAVVLF